MKCHYQMEKWIKRWVHTTKSFDTDGIRFYTKPGWLNLHVHVLVYDSTYTYMYLSLCNLRDIDYWVFLAVWFMSCKLSSVQAIRENTGAVAGVSGAGITVESDYIHNWKGGRVWLQNPPSVANIATPSSGKVWQLYYSLGTTNGKHTPANDPFITDS